MSGVYGPTDCPRCGRRMATMRNGVIRRHKDAGGEWCKGNPKTSFELMLEVLDAVQAERAVLSDLIQGYIDFGDVLHRASETFEEKRQVTSVLIKQTTERIHAEVEILKARNDSLVT